MLLIVALALHTCGHPARIIRRADRADSAYLALGRRYAAVGRFGRLGDGTLIAGNWVVTAAHVARAAQRRGLPFEVGGRAYAIGRVVLNPEWTEMGPHDVGLVQLTERVEGVTPIGLYRESGERALTAVLVGHGGTGTGASRARSEDGRARGATSRIDSTDASWLYFSFDAPPSGTDLEGAPGPGDSGGPAIVEVAGTPLVAGVSVAGYDGRDGPGSYGAVDVFTRISTHLAWIDSVLTHS